MVAKRKGDTDGQERRAAKQASVDGYGSADFRGYVNLNLSAEQKDAFERWSSSAAPYDVLEHALADGVQFALKWEHKQSCYLASATQRRSGSPNAGLVVTARASGGQKALLRVLFCLAILGHAERWEDVQPVADPDRW